MSLFSCVISVISKVNLRVVCCKVLIISNINAIGGGNLCLLKGGSQADLFSGYLLRKTPLERVACS